MNCYLYVVVALCVLCTPALASAQNTVQPDYDPNWNDALITHFGFGITFGVMFEDLTDIRFSRDGEFKQTAHFYLGLEGIAGRSYGKNCGLWDPGHFLGATFGFDYTFTRGTFTLYSEASYNYLAGAVTPGIALGLTAALSGPKPGIGIQATESAMNIHLRQRYNDGLQVGVGLGVPFARAPVFTIKDNCTNYIEG